MNKSQKITAQIKSLHKEIAELNEGRKQYILKQSCEIDGKIFPISSLTLIQCHRYGQEDWYPSEIKIESSGVRVENIDYEKFKKDFYEKFGAEIESIIPKKDAPYNPRTQEHD